MTYSGNYAADIYEEEQQRAMEINEALKSAREEQVREFFKDNDEWFEEHLVQYIPLRVESIREALENNDASHLLNIFTAMTIMAREKDVVEAVANYHAFCARNGLEAIDQHISVKPTPIPAGRE